MKRLNLKQTLTLSLLALSLPLLTACGASKVGPQTSSADYASRNHPGNNTDADGNPSGTTVYAECAPIPDNSSNIEGRMTTFYHPTSGEFIPEYIRLQFDLLPSEVTTTSTHYIQMFKWLVDSSGKRKYGSAAVGFYFQLKSTKEYLNSSPLNTISKATLQNIISNKGLSSKGVSLSNFFDKVILVLDGMDLTYDAIAFAHYDDAQGSSALTWAEALLPAFAANPNSYAATHSSSILRELHPFWSYRNASHTDEQYRTESMNYCIPN